MDIKEGLYYSKDHEWVRVEGDKAYIGITDYAQHALGDIVYLEMPPKGKELKAGDVLAVAESVKTASEIFSPIDGTVSETNTEVAAAAGVLNADPYGKWVAALESIDKKGLSGLMDEKEYAAYCQEGS